MRESSSSFVPTRWTIVAQARGDDAQAQEALSELCDAYYEPVIFFLQREGRSVDSAQELAHDFFAKLLSIGIGTPDPNKGRFRNYLLGALKHFLSNHRDALSAKKRGQGVEHLSFSAEGLSDGIENAVVKNEKDNSVLFDRDWALHLLQRALDQQEKEHEKNPLSFQTLKPWIDGGATEPQEEVAKSLGISATAAKVAIHRLRKRFRELVRHEITQTIDDSTDVEEELSYLISVVSQQ